MAKSAKKSKSISKRKKPRSRNQRKANRRKSKKVAHVGRRTRRKQKHASSSAPKLSSDRVTYKQKTVVSRQLNKEINLEKLLVRFDEKNQIEISSQDEFLLYYEELYSRCLKHAKRFFVKHQFETDAAIDRYIKKFGDFPPQRNLFSFGFVTSIYTNSRGNQFASGFQNKRDEINSVEDVEEYLQNMFDDFFISLDDYLLRIAGPISILGFMGEVIL